MRFPHSKHETETHGLSPGNGTTEIPLSRAPLATEGEATPGPDDYNPYDERERKQFEATLKDDPTEGDDPYAFDDVDEEVREVELPSLGQPNALDFSLGFDF